MRVKLVCCAILFAGAAGILAVSQDDEVSGSGASIDKHRDRSRGWETPSHSARNLVDVQGHVEEYIGKVETVLHEIASDLIHLDVFFIPASSDRPYQVLVTSGMSELPMSVPEGLEEYNRAELLMVLPTSWPINQEAFGDEANYWPVRWLKRVGRLPHENSTWIGWGHTVPNGNPPMPIGDTAFIGVMASTPHWLPPEFSRLNSSSGDVILFYQLVPLYQDEMILKLAKGAEELEQRFEKVNLDFVLNTNRQSVANKKNGLVDDGS